MITEMIPCPDCKGEGNDSNGYSGFGREGETPPLIKTCEKCEGTGEIPNPNNTKSKIRK
jgi:DnaJ-class molecular chaperone